MIFWCQECHSACRMTNEQHEFHFDSPHCGAGHTLTEWPEAESVFQLAGFPAVKLMAEERAEAEGWFVSRSGRVYEL